MTELLQLTDIFKTFGGVRALRGVSFQLRAGEVHALIGENGAGKSTLMRIITGAHAPDAGTIVVGGKTVEHNSPGLSRSLGIAPIYQQPALFPDLTVAENIALRLERAGAWRLVNWRRRQRHAAELLSRVGASISPALHVRSLSMPQQQLVEIASALGSDARILILDEPTASLSDREVDHLFAVIGQLRARGVGMIYTTHRLEELPRIADRVTVLRDGSWIATESMQSLDRGQLIKLMVGRSLDAVFPKIQVPIGDVVIETRALLCASAGVKEINLSVRAGEIFGLAGLVGAGRTELAGVLFGLTAADSGQILLKGQPVEIKSPIDAVRNRIAYVPEDRRRHGVILELSVASNTTLAILSQIAHGGWIDLKREQQITNQFIERFGIKTPSPATLLGDLSGGNQQKVALARWLAMDPAVIILDEPTQGVDVGAKAEIHRLIGELARRGMAILMISSELPEILGMCDRIAVMHAGRIVETLDRGSATQERIIELALGHGAASEVAA